MITCFTPGGFIRFGRSILRFYEGADQTAAMVIINQCARANFDAYRAAPEQERRGRLQGIDIVLWEAGAPYHTEVQLYKAAQTLKDNINESASPEAAETVNILLDDLRTRFSLAYGMGIEDGRTVYELCESTLEPEGEPITCLRRDCEPVGKGQ